MKKRASGAVQEAAMLLQEPPVVMIIGVQSRTHFVDHDRLAAVLGELRHYLPDLAVVHCDALPFDDLITRYCRILGIHCDRFGPDPLGPNYNIERCPPYARDPAILELASLLIVFPKDTEEPDGHEDALYDADLNVVMHAESLGMPILVVWRGSEELMKSQE